MGDFIGSLSGLSTPIRSAKDEAHRSVNDD